jgi:hypothetical protein
MPRKRRPSAAGYLVRSEDPLPEELQGIAISTFGKIIKRGWDWLGLTPDAPDRIGGLVEAPALAAALTLNKGDFIRAGSRGALYLAYRKAIQEAIGPQLAQWGTGAMRGPARPKALRLRDIESVLRDLARDFPLLGTLMDRRRGARTMLPAAARQQALDLTGETATPARERAQPREAVEEPASPPEAPPTEPRPREPESRDASSVLDPTGSSRRKRAGRLGLEIRFESRPDDLELARLVDSTVWINEAHPAYRRALASRSVGYHLTLSVAMALAPLTVDAAREHEFVTTFLARWGEALEQPHGRSRPRAAR